MSNPTLQSVDTRLTTHEAVCAERWAAIREDVRSLKSILLASGAMTIGTLLGIVGWLLSGYLHVSVH